MPTVVAMLLLVAAALPGAADTIIKDGDTLQIGATIYRLENVDAPERDQICLDEKGKVWRCGVEARDRLVAEIGSRTVRCHDIGPDRDYPKRHIGNCTIEGETVSLSQWLVREGWAIELAPNAKARFEREQVDARVNGRGLWKGCFAPPMDVRRWNMNAAELLGNGCRPGHTNRTRIALFPDSPTMPLGCPIKGKIALRAQFAGDLGVYHLQSCPSYQRTKSPERWFCSEEDAQAAGFRKAYTCR